MKPSDAPRLSGWSTSSEIAAEFGISRQSVNTMIHNGEFSSLCFVGSEAKPLYLVTTDEVQEVKSSRVFPRAKNSEESTESA